MVASHIWYYTIGKDVTVFECTLKAIAGCDPVNTYYMAVGWHRGYCGMQVNGPTDRRFLFSVWDTSDGKHKVEEVGGHPHACIRPFGGEGTGIQCILYYRWKTGDEYSFRVSAQPEGENTIYSGFVWLDDNWMLIGSLRAPKDGKYLEHIYSFIENFGSDRTNERKCHYKKQRYQLKSTDDTWYKIDKCRTTTTKKKEKDEHFHFEAPEDDTFCMSIDGGDCCHANNEDKCCKNPGKLNCSSGTCQF